MTTLLELFDRDRERLRKRLLDDQSPDKAAQAVRDFLDSLLAAYSKESTADADQKRLSIRVIDAMKASVSMLVAASETQVWLLEQPVHSNEETTAAAPSPNSSAFLLRALKILLTVVLLVLLFLDRSLIYFGLVIILIGLELIGIVFSFLNRRVSKAAGKARVTEPAPTPQTRAIVKVKVDLLLAKLAEAVLSADKALTEIGNIRQPASGNGIESDSALLELFQDLLGAREANDGEFVMKQLKAVPYLLQRYGIEVENFSSGNQHLFDFVPSLNPNNRVYTTLKPALIKDKRSLKRGLVEEPSPGAEPDAGTG
jgi:hypothetical protein